jgi:hypothetical protein
MTIEEIRKFRNAEPFRPFRLHLSDGRRFLVKHPENIGWSSTGQRLAVYERADAGDGINLENIVKVEPARNGAKKRRGCTE